MVSFGRKLIVLSFFTGIFSSYPAISAEINLNYIDRDPSLSAPSVSSAQKPSSWGEWVNFSRQMSADQAELRRQEAATPKVPASKSAPQSSRSWFQFARALSAVATQAITDPGAFVESTGVLPYMFSLAQSAGGIAAEQLQQIRKDGVNTYVSGVASTSKQLAVGFTATLLEPLHVAPAQVVKNSLVFAKEHPLAVVGIATMTYLRLNGVIMEPQEDMSFLNPGLAPAVAASVRSGTDLTLATLGFATAVGINHGKVCTGFAKHLKNRNFVERLGTATLCGAALYVACNPAAAAAMSLIPSLGASVQISQTGQNAVSISNPIEVPGDTVCVFYQVGSTSPEIWGACTYTTNTTNLFQMAIAPGAGASAGLYSSNTILVELLNAGKVQIVPWNFVAKTLGTVQTISPVTTDALAAPGIAASTSTMQALASYVRSSAGGYHDPLAPISGASFTVSSAPDMAPLTSDVLSGPVLTTIPSGQQAIGMWADCIGCISVGTGTTTFKALSTLLNGTATSSIVSASSALSNANTVYGPLMTPISMANNVFGGWIAGIVPQGRTIAVGGALGSLQQVTGFTSPTALCLGSIPNTPYLLWAVQDAPSLVSNDYLVVTDYTTGAIVTGITLVASSSASPTVVGFQSGTAGYFSGKGGVVSYNPISFSQGSTTVTTSSSGAPATTGPVSTTVATTSGAPASTGPASTGPTGTTVATTSGAPASTGPVSTTGATTSGPVVTTTSTTGNGTPAATSHTTGVTSSPKPSSSAAFALQPSLLLPVIGTLGVLNGLTENFFPELWSVFSGALKGAEIAKERPVS